MTLDHWDVIVVGTGMGSATVGYALAKQVRKVLFREKGRSLLGPDQNLRGDFTENVFARPEVPATTHRDLLLSAGRYADGDPRHIQ
jgi:choline dehydrogenase-like flavoprotein